jgi:O-antigen ligase
MVPGNPLAQRTQQAIDEVVAFSQGEMVWGGASARLELWKVAGDIIQNNPFLGVGQGAFKPILLAEISKGKVSPLEASLKEPHNIFLNAMVNSGLLGLLAVAICFIVPLYLFIGFLQKSIAGRSLAYAGIILVGSFFHFGLTESLFQRNIYINFYLVMLAFILSHLHLLALEQSGDDESIVKKTPVAPNNNNIGGFM